MVEFLQIPTPSDTYTTIPIAYRWDAPMENLSALDPGVHPATLPGAPPMPEWSAQRLPVPPLAPSAEQAELAKKQGLWRWLADEVVRTRGHILMLDRLIPGLTYTPAVPRAVGSETLQVRAGWVESWHWLPTGFSVPVHAVDLVERWLGALGVRYAPMRRPWENTDGVFDLHALKPLPPIAALAEPGPPQPMNIPEGGFWPPVDPLAFYRDRALAAIQMRGLVKMRDGLDFLPWQKTAATLSWVGYWKRLAITWSPGAGKTIGALLWCAARARPLLVLTPSQGKSTWAREIATNAPGMDAFSWTAPSLRRKRDRTLDEWENDCRRSGRLPVLIVSHETMTDAWEAGDIYRLVSAGGGPRPLLVMDAIEKARQLGWTVGGVHSREDDTSRWETGVACVLDEGHLFRNPKRWKGILNPDGTLRFEARRTAKGEMLQTFALMEIGRWATARCITTGTPIANQLDQYWVQLDWLDGCTGGFGTYYNFCGRYVGGSLNEHGGWEAPKLAQGQKPPNSDELRRRLGWFAYEVPYSVSHGALPAKRRTTTYLPPGEQVAELGSWTQLLKEAAKLGPNALLEARLQRACSRKRKYVVARAVEYIQAGLKVLILTGRRKDCEVTADLIAKLAEVPLGDGVWWAHGGLDQDERDRLRDAYMAWRPGEGRNIFERGDPRGACLVGTYDSFGIVVNLQDTDVLLCPMLPHTWDKLWQGENRVARIGQQRPVLVEYIIAEGTDDEAVAGSFIGKLGAIGALTADEEIAGVGESLAGLTDTEGLLASVWDKITGGQNAASDDEVEEDPETTLAAE